LEASNITINGNIDSLKKTILNEIEGLYDLELSKDDLLPYELVMKLAEFTGKINREIAVYINRKGTVVNISIGDSSKVALPEIEGRRGKTRLSGIRCIHTHPNGDAMLSSVDISSLLSMKLDTIIALGVKEGELNEIYAAIPSKNENGELNEADIYGPFYAGDEKINYLFQTILEIEKSIGNELHDNAEDEERAIIVGLETSAGRLINGKSEAERSLEELEELSLTAGVAVLKKVLQKKSVKDSTFYVGKGMVEQISLLRQSLGANVIIFDDELSGAQVKNIEKAVGIKVIDRTTLILEIFAQRARSKEGKLQVELAQLKYRLPRLIGLGGQLSRLGGGIGTRGPGEKKLEVDRRHIRRRISNLENELEDLGKRRNHLREGRKDSVIPTIALVGYTNVGKSTLLNKLCNSEVYAENKLFATLDPTTRNLKLPDGRETLLIDTVGFIRKLPHELIEAFKSTLEETVFANILLHVVDVSSDEAELQISVVNEILNSLGALNKPVILVFNKIDLVEGENIVTVKGRDEKGFEISAVTGKGLATLLDGISEMIPVEDEEISIFAPYSAGWVVPYIFENGKVLEQDYVEDGLNIKAIIKKTRIDRIKEFLQ